MDFVTLQDFLRILQFCKVSRRVLTFCYNKEKISCEEKLWQIKKMDQSTGDCRKSHLRCLPDTTEIIGRAIDNTRPIIEKELDRHNDRKTAYTDLDNVIHLDVQDATQIFRKSRFSCT